MIEATRSDKAAWFPVPDTVVAADVCPVSGRLATSSCMDHRRQYFLSGTEPLEYCDVHQPSLFKRIFGLASVKPAEPAPIDAAPEPAAVPKPADVTKDEAKGTAPEAPEKKRGFWSRIFRGSSKK
jgi:hypothetical protein